MKKENFYSIAYAFVLTLILVGTSLSAQYASVNTEDYEYSDLITELPVEATYNVEALKEISDHLKGQLDFYKEVLDLSFSQDAIIKIEIKKNGEISGAQVIKGGNRNLNQLMVHTIRKIERVTPITLNGEAIDEAVFIPVKFR